MGTVEIFSSAEAMKGYWNYRVMAEEHEFGVELRMHEVYYHGHDIPHSYTENGVSIQGENIADLEYTLNKMKEALKKPILQYGDGKFPQSLCRLSS